MIRCPAHVAYDELAAERDRVLADPDTHPASPAARAASGRARDAFRGRDHDETECPVPDELLDEIRGRS